MHAPLAMSHHRDMIQPNYDMNVNEMNSMPLLFTSYESYIKSTKTYQKSWNSTSDDAYEELLSNTCKLESYRGRHRFCKAVRVDMENSKKKSFNNIISSTLSLITGIFEDVFDAVNIQNTVNDHKHALDPRSSISLLNETETSDGFEFEGGIIKQDE